ncbi:uncharacterized protein [Diadema setosum]|uniref:uncharacterized protein n=1 Tax=Diadema setosum TaxID=31175 RepID=UPI003B3AC95B
MEASEFKDIISDILDILQSCDLMRNLEVSECGACCNVINENESKVPCEDCGKQFHVMCTGTISEARLCDARLIWICSACGSNNIAHRIFDKVGIPCHFNRYELLEDIGEDDFGVDISHSSCKSNQWKKSTKRLKKRHWKRTLECDHALWRWECTATKKERSFHEDPQQTKCATEVMMDTWYKMVAVSCLAFHHGKVYRLKWSVSVPDMSMLSSSCLKSVGRTIVCSAQTSQERRCCPCAWSTFCG